MPRLSGYRDRSHKPLWDTLIAAETDLPCDAWLVCVPYLRRQDVVLISPAELASGAGGESIAADDSRALLWNTVPHEYPAVRALELKVDADAVGWSMVIADGWTQIVDRWWRPPVQV